MPDATNTAQPLVAATKPSSPPPSTESPTAPAKPEAGQPSSEALSVADIKAKNELKKEMQRVAQERQALAREKAEIDEFKKRQALASVDPDAFLKPVYGDKWYEALTKAKLGDDSSLAIKQLREEFESRFKEQQAQAQQEQAQRETQLAEEKQKAEEEARVALEEYRNEATSFVKEKADDYQVINALGLEAAITEKTQTHYAQTKKILTHKEAADLLESELDKAVEKVLATKKWTERLGKQEPPKPAAPQFGSPRSAPSTIDNGMRAGAAPQNQRPTREEKLQRAMARLDQWEAEKKAQAQ